MNVFVPRRWFVVATELFTRAHTDAHTSQSIGWFANIGTISRLSTLQSPGMFSIAISTCQRDIWNRSSFHNANVIIEVMTMGKMYSI